MIIRVVSHPKERGMTLPARLLLCAAAAFVVGCSVPIKHPYFTAPSMRGTVTRAGKPVQGIHMQLVEVVNASGETAPGAATQEAVTDAQGHFTLGPIRQTARRLDNPLFKVDQHTVPWALRISNDGQTWRAGWLSDPDMLGEVPTSVVIAHCDLDADSRSSVIDGDVAAVGKGPCHLKLAVAKKP
jgi:hypothetical protein